MKRVFLSDFGAGTIGELSANIREYFDDLKIIGMKGKPHCFSLYQLMQSIAVKGDVKNLPSQLMGSFVKCIFQGTSYPHHLLAVTLSRLKDEEGISGCRAALIKGWLNRYARRGPTDQKEVLLVSLDESNENIGYRLGRLFAVLEKIEEEAHGKNLQSTIRNRFYGAASTVPVTVFPNLMRLKNHHLAKLDNQGGVVNFEKLMGNIMETIIDFPSLLTLPDQGRFAIGYYHQRQDL